MSTMTTELSPVEDITTFLDNCERMMRNTGKENGLRYMTLYGLVLGLGRAWETQALPPGFRRGEPQQCFLNTLVQCMTRDGLRYVEGYVLHPQLPIPIEHAWAVDEADRVIDVTLGNPEAHTYFGVEIPLKVVQEMVRQTERTGFFGSDWLAGNPVRNLGKIPSVTEIRRAKRDQRAERKRRKALTRS